MEGILERDRRKKEGGGGRRLTGRVKRVDVDR